MSTFKKVPYYSLKNKIGFEKENENTISQLT